MVSYKCTKPYLYDYQYSFSRRRACVTNFKPVPIYILGSPLNIATQNRASFREQFMLEPSGVVMILARTMAKMPVFTA